MQFFEIASGLCPSNDRKRLDSRFLGNDIEENGKDNDFFIELF